VYAKSRLSESIQQVFESVLGENILVGTKWRIKDEPKTIAESLSSCLCEIFHRIFYYLNLPFVCEPISTKDKKLFPQNRYSSVKIHYESLDKENYVPSVNEYIIVSFETAPCTVKKLTANSTGHGIEITGVKFFNDTSMWDFILEDERNKRLGAYVKQSWSYVIEEARRKYLSTDNIETALTSIKEERNAVELLMREFEKLQSAEEMRVTKKGIELLK
jgi:hypothetical protein